MNYKLHATYTLTIIFLIFALALRTCQKDDTMGNLKEGIKRLQLENRRHEKIEENLLSRIEKDSLLILDLGRSREKVITKRRKNEERIADVKSDINSTDSITDLLICADIIRKSHEERLSDN
jgi:hypothetical protein